MAVVIGMDEAGYGPNLGPLVITVTAWEVPDRPQDCDFWSALESVVTSQPAKNDARLHVGDSKQVYSPARGLGALERSVLGLLNAFPPTPTSFRNLWSRLHPKCSNAALEPWRSEPWFACRDLEIPCSQNDSNGSNGEYTSQLAAAFADAGIRLRDVRSDLVLTSRFNQLVKEHGSKGLALSRTSLALLRQVWNPAGDEPALIIADKHGGRNCYNDLLHEICDGHMLFCTGESRECSTYKLGATQLRFQTKAEQHFPVAVASMISKYMRELAMELFNAYWLEQQPDVKPTKGYPGDAARFRRDVTHTQKRLSIADEVFWRCR